MESDIQSRVYSNPIDVVEQMGEDQEWPFKRSSRDELIAEIEGLRGFYILHCIWREELNSFHLSMSVDLSIPKKKMSSFVSSLSSINDRLWLGHFEICSRRQKPIFRYTALLPEENQGINQEFVEKLIEISVAECTRFFPVFDILLGEKVAAPFLDLALADPLGTA